MRRLFFFSFICLVISGYVFANQNATTQIASQKSRYAEAYTSDKVLIPQVYQPTSEGGLIWRETFETPSSYRNWQTKDNTVPRPPLGPSEWIINDWNAFEGSAWRCADLSLGDNGGYDNHWYQVLDTPPLTLDANATLTFLHRYAVEDPAGASAPYDAWDGMNLRISTDGGASFEVLPVSTYNVTSIWAFGHPEQGHNEGPGIPGWAGTNDTWTPESIDLSAWTSADTPVIIRFAFASDMGYSTGDGAPQLYGWQIDNIVVATVNDTIFSNFGSDQDMIGKSNEYIPPAGGDLWHIVKIDPAIPAALPEFTPFGLFANHALACQNSGLLFDTDATYNPYMDNIAFTGPIHIPDIQPVYLDYKYVPFFLDGDAFPDVEFFRPEVSTDGENWEYIEAQPYVYSFAFDQWLEFAWTYGYPTNLSMFDLSRFAGQDIYLSFRFWSDYDNPQGFGLLIDDIAIFSPTRAIPAPQNFTATADAENQQIVLNWDMQHEQVITAIYRRAQGESGYKFIDEVQGVSQFIDSDITPYLTYSYLITSTVKYTGTSDPAGPATAQVIPAGVFEIAYEQGQKDTVVVAGTNLQMGVHFIPPSYPVELQALKVYLDKGTSTGTAAQFAILLDDGPNGTPGTPLMRVNKSGLTDGFNVVQIPNPVTFTQNGFYITYKRYGNGLSLGAELAPPVSGHTWLETANGWEQQTSYDVILRAYVDTTVTSKVDVVSAIGDAGSAGVSEFRLKGNYPNPFNPQTTILYDIPKTVAGNRLELTIFNIAGERVRTLVNENARTGQHTAIWNGTSESGAVVPSGIYIARLRCGSRVDSQRLLLLK